MNELEGQVMLVALLLGEDARELTDWEAMALHEESLEEPLSSSEMRLSQWGIEGN